MEGFYRKEDGAKEISTKGKKKRLFLDQDIFSSEEGKGKHFYHADFLFFYGVMWNRGGSCDRLPVPLCC